ncbi:MULTISPECIES: acetylglutamate kinase [Archaeoglobus]|jgi:acetylglutamate kinase|uniref:Acetylglutamate kinase n=3 Tax=Archaeoglobus fulgidus TaxID=2234 RepID=ARGB_ARCFU|nr:MULTISPECIES: acetylglutamate kinase [Archaeoglobus]O28988.1 RecName: Full=Acetylglutamate kinase; AltName: Full=N-acetyl-L-glutamate 5-phosphotransferase; AltName: Full=NAG kinase; Short=NAGK [Archaeoglobus fulgidus DSM 4304]AAB89966.1 acetylglutamate kinase (argB) [Archaeoglobus fulgidus DSM 4304]AIG98159.1 acetylglutamate kinase [Archaeoglobus fulgidus DSM 8774]KUJ92917.1 MAG: putative acetylglutamate kinase [Archaeoglobus fulgidus]KUK06396.1 MAG: putative acetylglutamate kinase [Archaeo
MENVELLIEALPYIKDFHSTTMVIKIGGHAMVNDRILEDTIKDIVLLYFVGIKPVVVHGGGPEISEKMEKFGLKPKFVEGLRVTDKETMEVVEMVLDGKVNSKIVTTFIRNGGKAVGLSGKDGLLIVARKKEMRMKKGEEEVIIDLGFVGETEFVNPEIIRILLDNGFIPVVSPVATDLAGNTYNLNADVVAGDIAAALKAKKLIMLTDVPGILENPDDKSTLISRIRLSELENMRSKGVIRGGMIPKVDAVIKALKSGVERAHIIDGSRPHSILIELFTKEGIGTMVEP